jgi:PBP1b-binding outer membrane lipoprotein LpoB
MKTRTVKYVGLILSLAALLSGCAGTAKSQTADKTPDITTGGYTVISDVL